MFGQHPKLQAVDPIGAAHGCGPTGGTDCWEVWKSQEITFFLKSRFARMHVGTGP